MKRILLLTRPICPPWDEGSKNFAYTLAKYAGDFEIHLLTCGKVDDLAGKCCSASDLYIAEMGLAAESAGVYFFAERIFLERRK